MTKNPHIDSRSRALDTVNFFFLLLFTLASQFSISVTQIALALGVLTWLAKVKITKTWASQNWPLVTPITAYIIACFISVITAHNMEYSFPSLKKLLLILVFFWVINSIETLKKRNTIVTLLIFSSTLAALFGAYQSWEAGVLNPQTRVEGTFSIYMTFAGILMMVGLVVASRWIFQNRREHWLLLSFLIISICLILTLTRQSWLGFLIGLIYLIWNWRKLYLLVLAVLMICFIYASPAIVKHRLHDMVLESGFNQKEDSQDLVENGTFQMRTNLWKSGIMIFKDHLLTGCGFKCVDQVHKSYPDPKGYLAKYRGMHNNFVQLAIDTGLLGLTAWVWIWMAFFNQIRLKLRNSESLSENHWVFYASAAALMAFLVGGVFENNFYDEEVVMMLYFIIALPFTCSSYNKNKQPMPTLS
jgi:putative inorganic carbon (HCO3(-)) transporter|tara:strand:- start:1069 stop:2316 length:1248 start_codon:yes stop_codon:yes gene_type:complete